MALKNTKKLENVENPKNGKFKKPNPCDSLDVHDRHRNFKQTNEVNVEPNATNVNDSLVEKCNSTHHVC